MVSITSTEIENVKYDNAAYTESAIESQNTVQLSDHIKSVSTSRKAGSVILRLSVQDMPETLTNNSTIK